MSTLFSRSKRGRFKKNSQFIRTPSGVGNQVRSTGPLVFLLLFSRKYYKALQLSAAKKNDIFYFIAKSRQLQVQNQASKMINQKRKFFFLKHMFSSPASDQPQVGPHFSAEEPLPGGGHALHGCRAIDTKCVKSRNLGHFSINRRRPQRGGQGAGQQRNSHTINKVVFFEKNTTECT